MWRKKIGLALGSGVARGLAYIGVLQVLQEEGIPIDMVAGTSAGAVFGALYVQGKDAGQLKALALEISGRKLAPLIDPSLPNIFHVLMQSLYIGTYSLVRASLESADVIIEPQVAHIGAGDFHHAQECIRQGVLAARDAIPEIRKKLASH